MTGAQYRILSAAGDEQEQGGADVEVAGGALVVAPSAGAVLRIPFGQISSVSEPEPFAVRVTLPDGTAIDLTRLGVMRTQLLAELADGRGDAAASAVAAVGEAATFAALCGGEQAEVRVYDDALLIVGSAGSQRISFSFAGPIAVQDYAVTVEVTGRDPVTFTRLGRRTDELAGLLRERLREARGRTSAFLGSLLPGLDPMALRAAAGLLRDGVAVPASTLDGIHPDLSGSLLQIATLPERQDAAATLARQTGLAIGFKQLASVRQAATGVTPWHDHAAAPHIGEHQSQGGAFQPGLMGMMAAGVMSGGPPTGSGGYGGPGGFGGGFGYGGYGDYWAFGAIGAGMNSRTDRPMTARPNLTRGRLTPSAEDLSALTATGEDPTVLAFVLGSRGDRVLYDVLNQPGPATFVYRVPPGGAAAINRALDDAGFQAAALHNQGLYEAPGPVDHAQLLISSLLGQVPHDGQWAPRIAEMLAG